MTNKKLQISVKTLVFFVKIEVWPIKLQLLVNHFILFLLPFFSEIISPWKKSIEFEFSYHEIDNLFEIDARSSKKTWLAIVTLQ